MNKKFFIILISLCFMLLSCPQINAQDNDVLRRDELADKVMSTYEYVTQTFGIPSSELPTFYDMENSSYGIRIQQSYSNGFMNGTDKNTFCPEGLVTKSEASVTLNRLLEKLNKKYNTTQEENQVNILDLDSAPSWAISSIKYMTYRDLMTLDNGKFYPNELITKEELQETITKIEEIFGGSEGRERIDFYDWLERIREKSNL